MLSFVLRGVLAWDILGHATQYNITFSKIACNNRDRKLDTEFE